MKNSLFILLISCFFLSCTGDESLIQGQWKYQEGYHFGDSLDFEENTVVRNDTIFSNSKPYAKFIKIRIGYFGIPAKLHLADLNTNEIGIYVIE